MAGRRRSLRNLKKKEISDEETELRPAANLTSSTKRRSRSVTRNRGGTRERARSQEERQMTGLTRRTSGASLSRGRSPSRKKETELEKENEKETERVPRASSSSALARKSPRRRRSEVDSLLSSSLSPAPSEVVEEERVIRRGKRGEEEGDVLVIEEKTTTHTRRGRYSRLTYHEVPLWLRDNAAIHTGYRVGGSFSSHFLSLFRLHNETMNVWTHLFGFFAMAYLCVIHLNHETYQEVHDAGDIAVFVVFFVCAMLMFFFSSMFHLFTSYDEAIKKRLNRLDYVGIACMIVGSFYPMVYYAFYCSPRWIYTYLTMITVLGILSAILTLLPRFDTPAFRPIRALLFSALGLVGILPTVHFYSSHEHLEHRAEVALYMVAMGSTYLIGAAIYAARIPERYYPGRFDLFLSSHQIFHICVVVAAFIHYFGTVKSFEATVFALGRQCSQETQE